MKLTEAHQAIYDVLKPVLAKKDIKIYDYLDLDESRPHVIMGKMKFQFPDGLAGKGFSNYEITQKIEIVTETEEKHQAIEIMHAIQTALEEPLQVEGAYNMRQNVIGGEVSEAENALFLAELDFNMWLQDH